MTVVDDQVMIKKESEDQLSETLSSAGDLLSFATIDIREVLDHGKPLLASIGKVRECA